MAAVSVAFPPAGASLNVLEIQEARDTQPSLLLPAQRVSPVRMGNAPATRVSRRRRPRRWGNRGATFGAPHDFSTQAPRPSTGQGAYALRLSGS